jgi:hypothetical protein
MQKCLANGVILPSNPYSQFVQPNWNPFPKSKVQPYTELSSTQLKKLGWIQPNRHIPRPNTQ